MLKRFRKSDPPAKAPQQQPPLPPPDPVLGDPVARRFREELQSGDWAGVHSFLEETREPMLRAFYIDTLSSIQDKPEWIDEWVAARPSSSIPRLFRGAHSTHWGWQARGGGRAKTVAKDAWPIFYERLVAADRDLAEAAAMDPDDPTPRYRAMVVAIGLQLGQDELRRRFEAAVERAPWHPEAHASLIAGITRKWGGSHDAAIGHGRAVLGSAPDGEPAIRVICDAHLERWLDFEGQEDARQARVAYFKDPSVQSDIRQAASRYIDSPSMQRTPWSHADRNVFAACFGMMNDLPGMMVQVRMLAPEQQLVVPWSLNWVRRPLQRMIELANRNPHLAQPGSESSAGAG